jgi:PAS domain S-box-containing protein
MIHGQERVETTSLFEKVLSTLKDYVYAFDQDGRFLYANQTLLDLWGLREAEALGKTMADLAYPQEVESKLLEGVKTVFATGQTVTSETFYTSPSGTSAYYENILSPVFSEDGRVAFVAGSSRDISRRKRTEQALREREGRLAVATEATALGVFEWKIAEDTAIWENERLYDIFGLTPEEPTVSQREFFETYLHPDDAEGFRLKLEEGLKSGVVRHAVGRIRRRDGSTRTIELNGKYDFAQDGSPLCLVGVVADITERVEQEERLRRNHETFYNLIQNAPFGVYIVDASFRLSQISSGSQKVFSNVRPLLGRDFSEVLRIIWPEPFASEAIGRFRHTLETGEPYHSPNTTERRSDTEETESYDWKIERIILPDGSYGVVCYFYDFTELHKVEDALRESEVRFRNMADHAPVMVWVTEPDGTCTFLSQTWYEFTGQTPETGLGFGWLDATHPDDREESERIFLEANAKREGFRLEYRLRHKDGSYRWAIDSALPRFSEDGEFLGYIGSVLDISERKKMELALRDQLELTSTLTNNATQAIFMMDARGYCTFMNPAAEAMLGFSSEEIKAKPLHDVIHHHHPDGRPYPMNECPIDRALPDNFDIREHEDVFIRKNGEFFPVLVAASPIFKDGRPVSTVIEVRDITERRRFEDALREANKQLQRLNEQQKRFVADAAHELRAPLTSIQGNLQMLSQYQGIDPATQQEMLGDVQRESERLGRLVNDLLAIARGDSGLRFEKTSLALEEVLLDGWRVAESLTTKHILELTDLPRTEVVGNADRLKQLAIILLENAINYTPEGGRVTLGLSQEQDKVLFYVRDTGMGISKDDLPHVFERFYRADQGRKKELSVAGTGLGLAIAQLIVQQHEGKIWLESELGKGTTVWVQLPSVKR